MAGQKSSGRGPRPGQVTRTSPTARPATAPERQAAGKQPRQTAPRPATAASPAGKNGNGAGSAGSRPAAKSRTAATAGGSASSAKKVTSPAAA